MRRAQGAPAIVLYCTTSRSSSVADWRKDLAARNFALGALLPASRFASHPQLILACDYTKGYSDGRRSHLRPARHFPIPPTYSPSPSRIVKLRRRQLTTMDERRTIVVDAERCSSSLACSHNASSFV